MGGELADKENMTRNRNATRLLNCMRNLYASGWTDEALIVDTAAQVIGGDEAAIMQAQRLYDKHFKAMEPN
jgi:hypothetical protein